MDKSVKYIQQDDLYSQRNAVNKDELSQISQFNFLKQSKHHKQRLFNNKFSKKVAILICLLFFIIIILIIFMLKSVERKQEDEKSIPQQKYQLNTNADQQENPIESQVKIIEKPKQMIEVYNKTKAQSDNNGLQTFQVQKKLWLFQTQKHKDLLQKLYYQNSKYFGRKSGFDLHIVSQNNYAQFISATSVNTLNNLKTNLEEKGKTDSNLQRQLNSIIYKITLLYILTENGGILLSDYYCLTETFNWIKDLKRNIHAKRGIVDNVDPQVFAFYNPDRSSPSSKENIKVQYQVDKYIRIFPGLEPYFLVAKKQAKFLMDMISEITLLLTNPDEIKKPSGLYSYYGTNQNNIYSDYFYIASHRILQRMQRVLDQQSKDHQYRMLALDYYGLYYITELGSARKFFAMFADQQNHVQFQAITKYTAQDWAELIGPFRQLTRFTPHHQMNRFLEQLIQGKKDPMIKGSLVQILLYPQSQQSFIIQNSQQPFVNQTNEPWSSLNKNVWVYWNSGIENAPLDNQLCVEVMRIKAKQSGFVLRIVSQSNLREHLDQSYIDKIDSSLRNAKVRTFPQSKSDLVRLALLHAHGGIYFDVSYFPRTNLDWIVKIGRYPSKYIFNRYGHLPKVLMQYNPQWGGIFDWKVNTTINTKVQWQIPYENNFIAAEKGNQFIGEWFQLLLSFYHKPYHEVRSILQSNGLRDMWGSEYLMPMDTLKCVIGRKQKEIRSNSSSLWTDASDYYKIWGLNGFMGFQKYRARTGYQSFDNPDNTFVYRYSQDYVKGFLGNSFNLIKLYGRQNDYLSNFISTNKGNNFTTQAHPNSIFMRYLFHSGVQFYFDGTWKIRH